MEFIEKLDKQEYEEFVSNHEKGHFLQSYSWGEFAKKEKKLIPHYVGLKNNKKLVAATLLLEKKLPFNFSYFYAPRGFVLDWNDFKVLKLFIEKIKKYVTKRKAIFIKIDPDLIINRFNYLNEEKEADFDSQKIIKILKENGFKHQGFTKNFETMQPRYSFRIDFSQDISSIYEHFSKTTKQRIKKAETLDIRVEIGDKSNIKDFYELMRITENRKDFVSHDLKYYETLYDIFNDKGKCNIFIGKIEIETVLNKFKIEHELLLKEKEELEKNSSRSKTQNNKLKEITKKCEILFNNINKYNNLMEQFGKELILNGHFIIEYGNKAWVLYAGNHNVLMDSYSNYKTYFEHIKHYSNKVSIYDQFGTIGDLNENNPLLGLHEFKKKFGGDYVEFIGEFDCVTKPILYFIFTKLVPFYRKFIKFIAKKRNAK